MNGDFVLYNISSLITMAGPAARRGAELSNVDELKAHAVKVVNGRIDSVGPEKEILEGWKGETVDAGCNAVIPGLVDPHTHAVYAGSRWSELEMRLKGEAYIEILKAGGGILSTVEATRKSSVEDLAASAMKNLNAMLLNGTTAVEIKSGYGLDLENEVKQLDAVDRCKKKWPGIIRKTFMGAHAVPKDYKGKTDAFLDYMIEDVLPVVTSECKADYADIFCEHGVFDVPQSRKYLKECSKAGLKLRIHADEIESMGGAELAVELGAASADHLGAVSDEGIKALASSETVAVLLPGTLYYLLSSKYAPARKMIEEGVIVSISTDFNPGSSPCRSMPQAMNFSCIMMRMTPAEVLSAATVNASYSLGLSEECGRIMPGMRADMVIVDDPDWRAIAAMPGSPPVRKVIVGGNIHQ